MNKKTLIFAGILVFLLVVLVVVYFLVLKPETSNQVKAPKENIENEFFKIKLIQGWVEINPPAYGAYAMAMKEVEQFGDPKIKELNFASYYSVIKDVFAEATIPEYLNKIKESLTQSFKGLQVLNEEIQATEDGEIYFIESQFRQNEVDFKVFLAIRIKDHDVWIISFNTLEEKWAEYKELFSQVAENFKIK